MQGEVQILTATRLAERIHVLQRHKIEAQTRRVAKFNEVH